MKKININRSGVEIHSLCERHLDEILALMNREGWYYYDHHELKRYIALHQACFTLISKGCVAGCIFTTNYDNQAWIGNVVMAEEIRGHGFGAEMLRAVMLWLEENRGIQTFRLGSVPLAIGLYKKAGFHAESFTSSQEAELPLDISDQLIELGEGVLIERLSENDLDEVSALDAQFFKSSRRQLFARLFEDSIQEASFALKANGAVEGFLMVRRRKASKDEAGFIEGPDYVYRVGPVIVLPKHGITGFQALFQQAISMINREVERLTGCAKIYIVFPKAARREVIYRETRALAEVMGVDAGRDPDAMFDEHEDIFKRCNSAKCEQQWDYLQSLGFHQEYFEQVMVYSSAQAEDTISDQEGIYALATPGDKG